MLFRQSEKRRKDGNETSIDAIMDALLYLRRVGVLVSSYYSMSQPPPLFTYSHSQNESSEYNAKKEMGLLMTYFDIPWSFISEYIDGITLHRESRTVVTSLNFQPIRIGLIQLPELFQLLLEKLDGETCTGCSIVPKRTALCLVCGAVLCYGSEGCRADSAHSKECGAGIGVYLVLNNTRVQIIRNDRSTRWGSPYLDVHGEEDQALSRGKPLFLNKERYAVLEQLWLFHRFDQDSRILGFTQRARVNAL